MGGPELQFAEMVRQRTLLLQIAGVHPIRASAVPEQPCDVHHFHRQPVPRDGINQSLMHTALHCRVYFVHCRRVVGTRHAICHRRTQALTTERTSPLVTFASCARASDLGWMEGLWWCVLYQEKQEKQEKANDHERKRKRTEDVTAPTALGTVLVLVTVTVKCI